MRRALLAALLLTALSPSVASAHIGSLNVVFESQTPPVPVRVIIRPPGVVPGLADIDVRVLTNGVKSVTVLPVHWRAGVEGSPPPDVAKPIESEPGLYHAELWLMARGAYNVQVQVETAGGSARFIVPVNSLATTRLPMSGQLGGILVGLGVMLFALAVTIVAAAVRESILAPGLEPTTRRRWAGRVAFGGAVATLALSLAGGRAWWNAKDSQYRNNLMYKPVPCDMEVRAEGGRRIAQLSIRTNDLRAAWPGLVPDHGKLMHVFLIREPRLDVLAHVHPARRTHFQFETALPPLPPGDYRVYADVTHENGLSQTLTTLAKVPELPAANGEARAGVVADPDDSWFAGVPQVTAGKSQSSLGDGLMMTWDAPQQFVAWRDVTLKFRITNSDGRLVTLDPYMNMLGHAAIRRDDGSVFTHLHPAGSVSMAAQQVFQLRSGENPPKRITPEMMEKLCQPPSGDLPQQPLTFPYEFPQPGRYRIWVQVKVAGQVRTGVFDADVAESK